MGSWTQGVILLQFWKFALVWGNKKIWHLLFHFIGSNTIEYHYGFWLAEYIGNNGLLLITLMLRFKRREGSACTLPLFINVLKLIRFPKLFKTVEV